MALPGIADANGTYGLPSGAPFANYLTSVTDPTTDWDAAAASQMIADCAGMTNTCVRAWARMLGNATTPTLQASNGYGAVWGSSSSYKPTPARTGAGVYTLTWPASVVDPLGNTVSLNLRGAYAQCEDAAGFFRAKVTAPNVVTVTCTDTSNVANDFAADTIVVTAW